jgi:hypothetical protein
MLLGDIPEDNSPKKRPSAEKRESTNNTNIKSGIGFETKRGS